MTGRKAMAVAACVLVLGAAAFFLARKTSEERVDEFITRARHFEKKGDYDSAIISLRNALRITPARGDVHLLLARNYRQTGKPRDTLKHYDAALRSGINDESAIRDYANACIQFNQLDELAKPARKLLQLRPDDADAHLWLARSLAADRPREAMQHVQDSLRARASEEAYILLAELHARNRDYENAESVLRQGLSQFPDNPQLMAGLASAAIELGKEDEACEHVERALCAVEGRDPSTKIPVLVVAADAYRRLGMHEQSIGLYRDLVELAPDTPAFRVDLAREYIAAGQAGEAADFLQQSIEKDPEYQPLRIALAEAWLRANRPDQAEAELDKLAPELASKPYVLYLKGSALLERGQSWRAEPLFRRAAEQSPTLVLAHLALGICYWRMNLVLSAEAEFQDVLKTSPDNSDAAAWLARCKLAQGDLAAAETFANRALAADERNSEAREILISCCVRRGQVETIKQLRQARGQAETSPEDMLTMARALAVQGRTSDAMATIDSALEKTPAFPEAVILKAKIAQLVGNKQEAEDLLGSFAADHPECEAVVLEYASFLTGAGEERRAHEALLALVRRLPESPAVHEALGNFYLHTRQIGKAADSMAAAAQLAPADAELRRRLVEALIRKGDLDKARAEVSSMRTAFGDSLTVGALEGQILLEEGKADEALARFESISRRWPKEAWAQVLIGTACACRHDVPAAIAAFERARDLAPRDARVRGALRDAYLLAGLYRQAAAEAAEVLRLRPGGAEDLHRLAISLAGSREVTQAREILQRLTSELPGRAEYHLQLATLLASEGKISEAQQQIATALQIEKSPRTIWPACSFYWQNAMPDAARQLIESIAESDRKLYHSLLARQYSAAEDIPKAEAEMKKMVRLAPDDPSALCALGDFYAQLPDRTEDAAEAYRMALELDAGLAYAKRRIAVLLARDGKLDEAERMLESLAREHPNDARVQSRLAEVAIEWMRLLRNGEAAEVALRRCTQLTERFPHIAHSHFLLALARFLREPPILDSALSSLRRALEIDPGFARARLLRIEIYRNSGRLPEAENECRGLLRAQPGSVEAMLLLGNVLALRKASKDEYEKVAEDFSDNPAAPLLLAVAVEDAAAAHVGEMAAEALGTPPPWGILKAYVDLLLVNGRAGDAVHQVKAFVDRYPEVPYAYRMLARTYAAAGDLDAAADAQQQAYARSGRSFPDLRQIVAALVQAGKSPEAVTLIRRHVANRPADNRAVVLLAQVLGRSGHVDEAIVELIGLLKQEPDNAEAHLTLATAYLLKERYSEAARHYEAVLLHEPSNQTAANNLAYILAEHQDQAGEAERVILPAVQRFPNSAPVQDTYGWILYKVGRPEEALPAIEKSNNLEPDNPLTLFHLAVVCRELQKTTRARDLLREALRLDANFEKADEARDLLMSLE